MIESLAERLCNWDRWGRADQQGTVNYITAEKVAAAAELIRTGEVFGLGIALGQSGPQIAHPRRFNPIHLMLAAHDVEWPGGATSADDLLVLPLQAGTQWDALAHVAFRGRMYGDRPAGDVTSAGASTNAISSVSDRIATRGVLADLARRRGVPGLDRGYAVTPDDLEDCLAAQGIHIDEGDVLLVRTGFVPGCRRQGWEGFSGDAPGLGLACLEWIHEHRLAGVAVDNAAVEVRPFDSPSVALPFHIVALVYMGLLMGEIFDLDGLATHCANDGRYEFFLVAPPLNVTGGIGSPINPYAIK